MPPSPPPVADQDAAMAEGAAPLSVPFSAYAPPPTNAEMRNQCCSVDGCTKFRQGPCNGMCRTHYNVIMLGLTPPSAASDKKKQQYAECPHCGKKITVQGMKYHVQNRVCQAGGGRGTNRPSASPFTKPSASAEKPSGSSGSNSVSKPANASPGISTIAGSSSSAHKKQKVSAGAASSIIAKSNSPGIAGPCPDFVYYVVKGWLSTTQKTTTVAVAAASARPKKPSKADTSLPSDTLLLLPQNDYDYWHYRLNLYLCNTWGDVRSLGESVYSDVKRRFLRIHAVKGYRYSEQDEDFFADDDRFNIWEDLGCHDARQQAVFTEAEWTYPYSIRKIMYDDTRRGAGVPFELRNSPKYLLWGKADRHWKAEMILPAEDRTIILNLIKTSGGKVREEPGLQDFLIAEVRYGRYSLDDIDTPFIREYRQTKLSSPKYDLIKEKNRHACEKLKAAQAEREAERAAQEAPPPPPPPPAMQHDSFGLGRPAPPPPPAALLQQNAAVVVSEEEESDEPFHRLRNRLLHDDKGIKYEYVPESSTDGPASIPFGAHILCCFTTGWDIGRVTDKRQCNSKQKSEAKQMKCPVLVYYESDGMYWLHDLGLDDAPYLSEELFQHLVDEKYTEEQEKGYLGYWCIVSPPENAYPRGEAANNKNSDTPQTPGILEKDTSDAKWNNRFHELCVFKAKNGHMNLDSSDLRYKWANRQRHACRNNNLNFTSEKKRLLDSIGFNWKGFDADWKDETDGDNAGAGDATSSFGADDDPDDCDKAAAAADLAFGGSPTDDAGSSDVDGANGKTAAAKAHEKGAEGPTPMEVDESDARKANEDEEKK